MSKRGVFNFHTEVNPQFSEIGKQDSSSDPDFLYYNGSIINNSTNTTQSTNDPQIQYQDTRSLPILKDKSKYAVSVENFSLNGVGKVLPVFIPQIRQYFGNSTTVLNTNPNNTIYDVTFTWQYGPKASPTLFQSTRTVQWQPQNQAAWTIQPPIPYVYPQLEIDYYYCYTYTWWLKLVNSALEMAWGDVKLAIETFSPEILFGTKCPYYTYDETNNLFSLCQDSNTSLVPFGDIPGSLLSTATPSQPPNPQDPYGAATDSTYSAGEFSFVGWNTNFDNLLSNFNTVYYSDGVPYPSIGVLGTRISSVLGTETCKEAIELSVSQQDYVSSFVENTLSFIPRTGSIGATVSKISASFPIIKTQSTAIPKSGVTSLELNIGLVSSYSLVVDQVYTINEVGNTNWISLGSANNNIGTTFTATGQATTDKTGNALGLLLQSNIPYLQPGIKLLATSDTESGLITVETLGMGNIIFVSSPIDLSENIWTLSFPSLTSSSVTTAGSSMLLNVGQSFSEFIDYRGTSVDLTADGTKQGIVSSYVDDIRMYSISISGNTDVYYTGTPYSFSPLNTYSNQNGTFAVGDIVKGQSSQTLGEIVEIIGPNTTSSAITSDISAIMTIVGGPYNAADTLTDSNTSATCRVVSVKGVNAAATLVYSGQKNIFKIGDQIQDITTGAYGTIEDITGENTGYATLGFIKQMGSFGNGELIVGYDPVFGLGGANIISVTGENTGYAQLSYINEHDPAGGLASIFTAGEYLTYLNEFSIVIAFAQVIIDNPQVNTISGNNTYNEGYVTARIIDPNSVPYFTGGPLLVTGSLSGTIADIQGINYPGTGTLLLNNISGSFYVGNSITDIIGSTTITAQVQNFNYLSGGILTLKNVVGEFGINNQISGPSNNTVNPIFALSNVSGNLSIGDILQDDSTGATGTISAVVGDILGTQVIQLSNITGNFNPGNSFTDISPYVTLELDNPSSSYGVLNIGDSVRCDTDTGSGIVNSIENVTINVFMASSIDPSPGDIFQTKDFQTQFEVVSYSSFNIIATNIKGNLIIGQNFQCKSTGVVIQIISVTPGIIILNNITGTFPTSTTLTDQTNSLSTINVSGITGNPYNPQFNIGDIITYGIENATATISGITGNVLHLNNVQGNFGSTGIVNVINSSLIYLSVNIGYWENVDGSNIGEHRVPLAIGDKFLFNGKYLTVEYVGSQIQWKTEGTGLLFTDMYDKQFIVLSNTSGLIINSSTNFTFTVYPTVKNPPAGQLLDHTPDGYFVVDAPIPVDPVTAIYSNPTAITNLTFGIINSSTTETTGTILLTNVLDTFPNAITQTYKPQITTLNVDTISGTFTSNNQIINQDSVYGTLQNFSLNPSSGGSGIPFAGQGLVLKSISGSGFTADETIKDLKTLATATYSATIPQSIVCIITGATGTVVEDLGTYLIVDTISQIPHLGEEIVSSVSSKAIVTDFKIFPVNSTVTSNAGWTAQVLSTSFAKIQLQPLTLILYPNVGEVFGNGESSAVINSIDNYYLQVSPGIAGSSWSITASPLVSTQTQILANPTTFTTAIPSSQSIFSSLYYMSFTLENEVSQQTQLFLPENVANVEVPQCKYQQLIPGPSFVNNPLSSPAWYLVMVQDFESTSSLWSPIASIVVATTFITVREEYSGTPITLGTGNLGGNATTSSFQKVLLEVPIEELPQTGYKGLIFYKPQVETLSSLGSSRAELKNIDVLFQWRNRLTNSLIPLELSNSGSATIRLLFKKIRD